MTNKKSILIIGAGPNNIQHGDEVDSATYQLATYLRRAGVITILADNNPFSYSLNDSSVIDHSSIGPLTVNHLIELIEKYQPRAILPTLGNRQAFLPVLEYRKQPCVKLITQCYLSELSVKWVRR